MPLFSARVELHDVSHDDDVYDTLHAAMHDEGFRRVIQNGKGKFFLLPTGSYVISGEYDTAQVMSKARTAAETTGHEFEIWLVEVQGKPRVYNLKVVDRDPDA